MAFLKINGIYLKVRSSLGGQLNVSTNNIRDSVRDSVHDSVRDSVCNKVCNPNVEQIPLTCMECRWVLHKVELTEPSDGAEIYLTTQTKELILCFPLMSLND